MEVETDGGLGVIFALLDPDPVAQINADPEQVQRSSIPNFSQKSQDSRDNMEVETDGGLGVIFALLDTDPATQINADQDPDPRNLI
jgi:hypothetical protein